MAGTNANAAAEGGSFEIEGLKQFLRLLKHLPKETTDELRTASMDIATQLANAARGAAHTPQQRLAAQSLKARRDRIPVVTASGTIRKGLRAQDIFYGAEFGGGRRPTTQQFPPHRGRRGYFLYPTARANGQRYFDMWAKAVDKAFEDWDYKPR